ncbi:NADH oxidase [Lactiplantibacillus plantarum]|nr:NADH oxidase [Lactiplantibacillus plantarum]
MKIVIVGCTHAGTAAAAQILKDHPEATVTIYERDDNISFLSCGIYLYLGGKVNQRSITWRICSIRHQKR